MAEENTNGGGSGTVDAIESLHKTIDLFRTESTSNFSEMIGGQNKVFDLLKNESDKRYEEERENLKKTSEIQKKSGGAAGAAKGAVPRGPGLGVKPGGLIANLLGAGTGIAAAGVGIGGFFLALAGAEAIMQKFGGGDNLKNLLINLATGLKAFDAQGLKALGAVIAGGAILGVGGGIIGATRGAAGLIGVGVGLGGFFVGLSAADEVMKGLGDGSRLKTLMQNIAGGISAFDANQIKILGGVMAVGAVAAQGRGGYGRAAKGAVGMAAIGAGIGLFFAGLALGDWAALGNGSTLKDLMTNVATGLKEFDPTHLKALAGMMLIGGAVGASSKGFGGVMKTGMAAVGMGLIGLGIGAFFAGLGAGGKLADILNIDGTGLKNILTNTALGLKAFNDVDGKNMVNVGGGILALAPGLAALLVTGGISGLVGDVLTGIKSAWNWITGQDGEGEAKKSRFEEIAEELKHLDKLKVPEIDAPKFRDSLMAISAGLASFETQKLTTSLKDVGVAILDFLSGKSDADKGPIGEMLQIADKSDELTQGATALERLAIALGSIADLKFDGSKLNMRKFAEDLVESVPVIETAIMGGRIKENILDLGKGNIELKGLASPDVDFATASTNIRMLQEALSGIGRVNAAATEGGGGNTIVNNVNNVTNNNGAGGEGGPNMNLSVTSMGEQKRKSDKEYDLFGGVGGP